jgi:hypothetical protein
MSRRFALAAPLAAILVAVASSAITLTPPVAARTETISVPRFAPRDLLADRLWDDGRAEYSTYEGTIQRYGIRRALTARIIVVKEDMDIAQGVKSDAGPVAGKTRTVLKQNLIRDFRTGTYDYHQMCSSFLDRSSGHLLKLAMSSTEGCGITFVELRPGEDGWQRKSHSYWDGEGTRTEALLPRAMTKFVSADALPLWLRRLDLRQAASFTISLLTSQVGNRVQPLGFRNFSIEVAGRSDRHGLPVRVRPLDESPESQAASSDRYWFDPAWPHPLVRFEGGGKDATVLRRVKTTRLAYWEKTAPGDERLVLPPGR